MKKWLKWGIALLIVSVIIISFYVFNHMLEMFQPDRFADNLIIPEDIELHIPLGERHGEGFDEFENIKSDSLDFELYNAGLPGIYELIFWSGDIEKGTVYLKAYEITNNYPLSPIRLSQASAIKVDNPQSDIKQFGPASFLIQEGDWNKFYAARFELWLKPHSTQKEERILLEKNYKIEGYSN